MVKKELLSCVRQSPALLLFLNKQEMSPSQSQIEFGLRLSNLILPLTRKYKKRARYEPGDSISSKPTTFGKLSTLLLPYSRLAEGCALPNDQVKTLSDRASSRTLYPNSQYKGAIGEPLGNLTPKLVIMVFSLVVLLGFRYR